MSQRASRCLFSILQLRRSGFDRIVLWRVYCAFVRSILTFAYPALCNVSSATFSIVCNMERRAEKIIGAQFTPDIHSFCENLCVALFNRVQNCSHHPLRELFLTSLPRVRRHGRLLEPPFAKTERFRRSFIRFARG